MKKTNVLLNCMIAALIGFIILLTSIEIASYNIDFYKKNFKANNISEVTKLDDENLEYISLEIISYLKDERDNLVIYVNDKNEQFEAFNEKEKLHMVDVKDLFMKGYILRNVSVAILFILLLIFSFKFDISGSVKILSYSSIIIILMLFLLIVFDFNNSFEKFHLILFNNNLWILDPKQDLMIQMLTTDFFIKIAYNIVSLFFTGIFIIFSVVSLINKDKKIGGE